MFHPHELGLFKVAYPLEEARQLVSIGRNTFYEIISRGLLKTTKVGKKSLVLAADLAELMNALREDPTLYKDRSKTTAEGLDRMMKVREENRARRRKELQEILQEL
jgi:hypothetical protein